MDIRIFVLFVFVGVLGSFTEARAGFFGFPYGNGGLQSADKFPAMSRLKREIGDSNGETTTKPTTTEATTTPPTDPTTTPATSPTTTPSTEPTTTPTTEATTPTTTPTTTSATTPTTTPTTSPSTTPTTPPTTDPTTPSTTPESTTTPDSTTKPESTTSPDGTTNPESTTAPDSTKPTKKPTSDVLSRSNFDEPEDSAKKPGPTPNSDPNAPTPGPYFGLDSPSPGFGPGQFGPGFDAFGYPGFNSIPGFEPNYGTWTGTNNGPGYASAGASAGSFAGGYPGIGYQGTGMGYPGMGYPGMGYPGMGYPGTGYPMAGYPALNSPSVDSRGGFQDTTPNPNPIPNGYNYGGVDPLYAGPGLYYPGQYPNFNDPSFDMIKQIQAQIEAQHQAMARSMASHRANQRGSNIPAYAYSHASASMGHRPTFGGSFGVGNSNMDFHNRLASEAANYGGGGVSYGGGVPQYSSASIGLGPGGGFQTGLISPAAPGIESRFAEDLPAPSGNSFGVFASSSSSSMTGPDGRPISHKSSITGVNDNGRVSFRKVAD